MPLIVPHNHSQLALGVVATPSATLPGISMTAGAANVKGSWVEWIAATTFDVYAISIIVTNSGVAAALRNALLDIGVGANPNETAIVPNICVGGTATGGLHIGCTQYWLPIYIPKGTRIAGRVSSTTASQVINVAFALHGGNFGPPFPSFAGCDAIGANTGASSGVLLTSGNTGTESAYTSFGSATTREYKALVPTWQTGTATNITANSYHFEFGYSSVSFAEFMLSVNGGEYVISNFPLFPVLIDIPSGTQLQYRGEASGTHTANSIAATLLGFY